MAGTQKIVPGRRDGGAGKRARLAKAKADEIAAATAVLAKHGIKIAK